MYTEYIEVSHCEEHRAVPRGSGRFKSTFYLKPALGACSSNVCSGGATHVSILHPMRIARRIYYRFAKARLICVSCVAYNISL